MKKLLMLSFLCGVLFTELRAQDDNDLWKSSGESSLSQKAKTEFSKHFKPYNYKFFRLKETAFREKFASAPSERLTSVSRSGKTITVPDAAGRIQKFRIVEVSMMAPQLAAKYGYIKTYEGQGIDDPTANIHIAVTSSGIFASVTAANKPAYYINPVDRDNKIYVINARNPKDNVAAFTCGVDDKLFGNNNVANLGPAGTTIYGNADDGKLRTYDLALCVNGEFSQFFLDGTEPNDSVRKAKVMDVLVACITRANEVYERDFGIRLQFVAHEDTLIFLDPATDPWPTKPPLLGTSWNTKTQQTIDARIGSGNYDIGHLLGKVPTIGDDNGNAGCIGCVCNNANKGSGFSAYYDPALIDYMVIDYWTHEMGHQFGANHTFTFSSEGTQAQIEPGSGSTIMGYAGITGSTDIQPHSDDLFSVASIGQVANYIKTGTGSNCPAVSAVGDIAPVAYAGNDYIIPKSTPFALSGTASDANATDALTFTWEETDVYQNGTSNTFPDTASATGPVFRVYNDTTSTTRIFPALPSILSGQNGNKWEVLPAVDRQLDFRFTVRDNHVGGGNTESDDMTVTVVSSAGPFAVTSPNTSVTWQAGTQQTIKWNVASSDAAPVNCTNVKISLSTDGGNTFPVVLAANTANDGSEIITVPNVQSTHCRIKVEAVGNIFFDINDTDFAVSNGPACPGQYDSGNNDKITKSVPIPLNTDVYGTISSATDADFYRFKINTAGTVSITLTNLPADYDIVLINSSVQPIGISRKTGTADESINATLAAGDYAIRVSGKNGAYDPLNCYTLKVVTGTASLNKEIDITDNNSTGSFKIYPNPVRSILNIDLPAGATDPEIQIYDVYGKKLFNQKSIKNFSSVDVSKLIPGIYFVRVINDKGEELYKEKFFKQ